jgi:hypothetical protein
MSRHVLATPFQHEHITQQIIGINQRIFTHSHASKLEQEVHSFLSKCYFSSGKNFILHNSFAFLFDKVYAQVGINHASWNVLHGDIRRIYEMELATIQVKMDYIEYNDL